MLNTPFSPWPSFTTEEADAVRELVLSNKVNYWTGTECRSFEKEFAAWTGSTHAVALANGTLALDVALTRLAAVDAKLGQVVELRYFGGLSEAEIATLLGRSDRSIRRDWQKARLFLLASLKQDD